MRGVLLRPADGSPHPRLVPTSTGGSSLPLPLPGPAPPEGHGHFRVTSGVEARPAAGRGAGPPLRMLTRSPRARRFRRVFSRVSGAAVEGAPGWGWVWALNLRPGRDGGVARVTAGAWSRSALFYVVLREPACATAEKSEAGAVPAGGVPSTCDRSPGWGGGEGWRGARGVWRVKSQLSVACGLLIDSSPNVTSAIQRPHTASGPHLSRDCGARCRSFSQPSTQFSSRKVGENNGTCLTSECQER